jgi:hypothetical protein
MLRVLNYRLRHYFEKWNHGVERVTLAEEMNTEGNVKQEYN